jgi:hypothetical protein
MYLVEFCFILMLFSVLVISLVYFLAVFVPVG